MFELAFRFRSYQLLALLLLAAAVGTALFLKLWPWLKQGRRLRAAVVAAFALHAAILAVWAATIRVDSDEVSHLHCSWLVSQGLTPFRDFWQDHSPLFWYLLAPVVARFHSPAVLVFSRALAGVLFVGVAAATGWLAWRVFRQRAAAVLAASIVLAMGVRTEAAWLRPDQLANLLVLASLALLCSVPLSRRRCLLVGIAFGLALALTPKPMFAALAFPFVILLSPEFPPRDKIGHVLYYAVGGIAGFLPLVVLLARLRITSEFIFWVFLYHAPAGRAESYFPAALALAGVAGAIYAFMRQTSPVLDLQPPASSLQPRLVAIAFLLQTIGGLVNPSRTTSSLMLWAALAAVLASPLIVACLGLGNRSAGEGRQDAGATSRRLALAALVLVLIEIDALAPLVNRRMLGDFATDRARIAWMIEQAGDRPVVLVTPVHNIFSRNATGLYELWQYSHHIDDPVVTASLAGFAKSVLAARPALIAAAPRRITDDPEPDAANRPRLFETLVARGILPPAEWQALEQFVQEKYALRQVDGELFYVLKEQDADKRR